MIRDTSAERHRVWACISGGGGANKTTGGNIAVSPHRALGASHARLPTADLWGTVSQVDAKESESMLTEHCAYHGHFTANMTPVIESAIGHAKFPLDFDR